MSDDVLLGVFEHFLVERHIWCFWEHFFSIYTYSSTASFSRLVRSHSFKTLSYHPRFGFFGHSSTFNHQLSSVCSSAFSKEMVYPSFNVDWFELSSACWRIELNIGTTTLNDDEACAGTVQIQA